MASTKAGGSAKNLNDSNPKYLGVKLADGAAARPGMVIVRQRGTVIEAGKNVAVGRDHTLFSVATGTVAFRTRRKTHFTGRVVSKKVANVV
ncbi:50S ribosomal protein L27 [Candidatus Kaiserbacteria bacterium]|nr:50S ribosomal protein L27 [Candidatus Kaiserbacteria bacterium]